MGLIKDKESNNILILSLYSSKMSSKSNFDSSIWLRNLSISSILNFVWLKLIPKEEIKALKPLNDWFVVIVVVLKVFYFYQVTFHLM